MRFYRYLYVGETVRNVAKIKCKLKSHAGTNVYLIALAAGADQLEIFHSAYLKQLYFRYHPPVVIGIAGSHDEAVDLVVTIARECLLHTGNCNLKEYLKQKTGRKRSGE